ncbi:permease [Actinoplanes sp. NPDC051411]|uniref:permease n=1 Tax=Actinoplanes sp. NPDC051411 TaxID=3155522 RepID=UPI0034370724
MAESLPEVTTSRRARTAGLLSATVIAVVVLLWAKWLPYAGKLPGLAGKHLWPGSSVLTAGDVHPGAAPSWAAAVSFASAYLNAVLRALVAALMIAAALQTLVPRQWLLRLLNRRGRLSSAVAGGLAGTPSMMCTCCTAPVVVSLKRNGVSTAAAVAYWLGNPLLNPAVIVFLLLVAPWQWTAVRLVVGALIVVAGAVVVAWLADGRPDSVPATPAAHEGPPPSLRRYLAALLRLALTLVPEYVVVVLLIGAFRGWLFPFDGRFGPVAVTVIVAAVAGTALVIPTAGEIPILQGLAVAGLATGAVGALLVTLPAVSIPGMVLVWRTLGRRATVATAAVVMAGGLVAAAALTLLAR